MHLAQLKGQAEVVPRNLGMPGPIIQTHLRARFRREVDIGNIESEVRCRRGTLPLSPPFPEQSKEVVWLH
jgi:hypothetical protein